MSLNRYAKSRDENEPPIVDAMRAVGAVVFLIDEPADLLVYWRRRWHVLEVKLPFGPRGGDHSKLEPNQRAAMLACPGAIKIVRDPVGALRAIGA